MTRKEIWLNFEEAKKIADEIEALADRLDKNGANAIRSINSNIKGCWRGTNSNEFQKKCDHLANRAGFWARNLRSYARQVRNAAQRKYDTEMENLRIAGY